MSFGVGRGSSCPPRVGYPSRWRRLIEIKVSTDRVPASPAAAAAPHSSAATRQKSSAVLPIGSRSRYSRISSGTWGGLLNMRGSRGVTAATILTMYVAFSRGWVSRTFLALVPLFYVAFIVTVLAFRLE